MKTLKNTFTFLLITSFTIFVSCKKANNNEAIVNATQQEKQIEKVEYFNKGNNSLALTEYYDKKGNKIKLINHSEKYGDSEKTFLYDDINNLIEEKEFDTKDELVETKFYEYKAVSDQEFLEFTYEKRKDSEKKLIIEDKLEYNDGGNLFRKSHRTTYGNRIYDYTYHSNNKIKEETILAYEETEKVIISYNSNGKRIEERIYRKKTANNDFKLELTNYWYYNSNGNEVTKDGMPIKETSPFTKKYTYFN